MRLAVPNDLNRLLATQGDLDKLVAADARRRVATNSADQQLAVQLGRNPYSGLIGDGLDQRLEVQRQDVEATLEAQRKSQFEPLAPETTPPAPTTHDDDDRRDVILMDEPPPDAQAPTNTSLLIFENPDKRGARPSGPGEAMPMWPFRLLLSGPPGSGKRNMLLNLVFRLDPPPSAIHIVHYDPETIEYEILESLGVPMFYYDPADFPVADNLSGPDPPPLGDGGEAPPPKGGANPLGACPLVIVDELTSDVLPTESKARFERLMNFGSTHRNTSVIASIQSVVNLPPKARRGFNQFCLWKQPDESASTLAATRAGIPPAMLRELFELCTDSHDSIWIDTDQRPDSIWRFRLNMLTPIRAESAVSFSDY